MVDKRSKPNLDVTISCTMETKLDVNTNEDHKPDLGDDDGSAKSLQDSKSLSTSPLSTLSKSPSRSPLRRTLRKLKLPMSPISKKSIHELGKRVSVKGMKHKSHDVQTNLKKEDKKSSEKTMFISGTTVVNSVAVHSNSKSCESFNPLLLISSKENVHEGPIWVMKFSLNGDKKYLATAGQDKRILVWEVAPPLASEESSNDEQSTSSQVESERDSDTNESPPPVEETGGAWLGSDVKLLSSKPINIFHGHEGDVVDLSWSPLSGFLLSASLDKTVRLWHISKSKCLHVFHHPDVVTSVDFDPLDDQFFVSGCFDRKVRLWSILDQCVTAYSQTPDIITSTRFTPDRLMIAAGLIKGQVYFYSVNNSSLRYFTQIACRDRHGSESHGTKVTGFAFKAVVKDAELEDSDGDVSDNSCSNDGSKKSTSPKRWSVTKKKTKPPIDSRPKQQILVTTNDSRFRLYGLDDFCLIRKFKGTTNSSSQIKASFSESGDFIVCGSETGHVHIWDCSTNNNTSAASVNFTAHKIYERSRAHASFRACIASDQPVVTDTFFVPSKCTKDALLASSLFPTLEKIDHIRNVDFSSAMVVTSDYKGTICVFLKKSCLDAVIHEAGPEGLWHKLHEEF